jgi:hypothetical protein
METSLAINIGISGHEVLPPLVAVQGVLNYVKGSRQSSFLILYVLSV